MPEILRSFLRIEESLPNKRAAVLLYHYDGNNNARHLSHSTITGLVVKTTRVESVELDLVYNSTYIFIVPWVTSTAEPERTTRSI